MDVLARRSAAAVAALITLTSCYAPSLRDCTVTCSGPGDCASGQVCGDDGMCASPSVAGRCNALPPPDAGADAGVDARPDAAATVRLRIQITGRGSVIVDGRGTCSSEMPQHGDCAYDIAVGVAQRLRAMPIRIDDLFQSWSMACAGQGPSCTIAPTVNVDVGAKFGH